MFKEKAHPYHQFFGLNRNIFIKKLYLCKWIPPLLPLVANGGFHQATELQQELIR